MSALALSNESSAALHLVASIAFVLIATADAPSVLSDDFAVAGLFNIAASCGALTPEDFA